MNIYDATETAYKNGYKQGKKDAERWISVRDRLPESGKQALCLTKRGEVWVAAWDDVGDHLWSDGEIWCSNGYVTHWMPLPQPPKGV